MTGIIIQARLGSTRLSNKMLLPFYEDKGILEIIFQKLITLFKSDIVVLATSENERDNKLEKLSLSYNIPCFRGSEENVLNRFIGAAEKYNIQKIIRVCGDNPFLDMNYLKELKEDFERENDCDYMSFRTTNKIPSIKTHYGFWAEGVTLLALNKVVKETDNPIYQEHVTNYIYQNPKKFNIKWKPVNPSIEANQSIRMTIDTKEDFLLLQKIYSEFAIQPEQTATELVEFVSSNEKWINSMKNQIIRNTK